MPDCFISYASVDEPFARGVYEQVARHGLTPFLAAVSLQPGQRWSPAILDALRASPWVLFLASRAACASEFVQQEIGGAVLSKKNLVPIVWDMAPHELPAWTREYQAIDIRGASVEAIGVRVSEVASRIKADKALGILIVVGAIGALLWASTKG